MECIKKLKLIPAYFLCCLSLSVLAQPSGQAVAGIAGYYSDKLHGGFTASGEKYDRNALTAAHANYPFGTKLKLTNLSNKKSVEVRVNDRPSKKSKRLLEISGKAAEQLAILGGGITRIKIERLNPEETPTVQKKTDNSGWDEKLFTVYKLTQTGIASYYSDKLQGRPTANGERYDRNALTAAHISYPFGTRLKVTNLYNHKSIELRVNDRCAKNNQRVIDVSGKAAEQLGMLESGLVEVELKVLELGG